MSKQVYLIEAVREKLERELSDIEAVQKPAVLRLIASNGAEIEPEARVDEALEDRLESLEQRRWLIETTLAQAKIVDTVRSADKVGVGSTVVVHESGTHRTYTIVGSVGADPERGWITTNSPLGASLLDKRRGEHVTYAAPGGTQTVTVVSVG